MGVPLCLAATDILVSVDRSDSIPAKPILNAAQYQIGHAEPFLVRANDRSTSGAVLIFGSKHTKDPLLEVIRSEFQKFTPTVVLCEGRMTGLLFPGLMNPVKTFGEPGLVGQLAYANGCDIYTWEPSPQAEVEGLLAQSFNRDQVGLRFVLSSYFSNRRFGKPDDPNATVRETLKKRKTGLRSARFSKT